MHNINQHLMEQLYVARQQQRIAEEKLQQMEIWLSAQNALQHELCDVKVMLMVAQNQLKIHENTIFDLRKENFYLKEQNCFLSSRLSSLSNQEVVDQRKQIEVVSNQEKTEVANDTSHETKHETNSSGNSTGDSEACSEANSKRNKAIEIKMKLMKKKEEVKPTQETIVDQSHDQSPLDLRFFVGRLSDWTREDTLKEYFSQFGTVVDVFMPRKGAAHRGFAFVSFSKLFGDKPLEMKGHVIDGKAVHIDCSDGKLDSGHPTRTLLVCGPIKETNDSLIKQHFSQFGKIEYIARSKGGGESRSRFVIVNFYENESVDRVLASKRHVIGGIAVDCRRARCADAENKKADVGQTQLPSPDKNNINKKSPKHACEKSHVADIVKFLVEHLTLKTTPKMLINHFSKFGSVLDAYIPSVYGSGESKRYGYVVMRGGTFLDFKGHVIDGASVRVSHDYSFRFKEESKTLLVSASPLVLSKIAESELRNFFSRFGRVTSVRKFTDPKTKKQSHYAFVEFTSTSVVEKVMENIGYYINGKLVTVTKSRCDPHRQ